MEPLIYYKDNADLPRSRVITVRGETEYSVNCKKYPEGYLVRGVDLQLNAETREWDKINKEIFDYELGKIVPEVPALYGIVAVAEDGAVTKGYYSANPYKNCSVIVNNAIEICIDYTILSEKYYREKVSDSIYWDIRNMTARQIEALDQRELTIDNANKTYNIEDHPNTLERAKVLYENAVFPIDADLRHIARYLGDLTFGVELETINGTLPPYILNKYGVIICKDGSLRQGDNRYPPEYVTIPLKGAKGLQVLRTLPVEIAKRSDVNVKCSYHLHIGGFTIDRVMMVSLFRLCRKIQNDVFKMFPQYKIKWKEHKEKNYCQKIPNIVNVFGTKNYNRYINDTYCDIYKFLTGGKTTGAEFNRKNKINPWGQNKWDIKTRYHWVNFINPVFGKRDTVEFRLHTPTLNPDKIINWLLMCVAIVRFAETRILSSIDNTSVIFIDVLNWYKDTFKTEQATKLSENLISYYLDRVAYFEADAKRGDVLSGKELLEDAKFVFNTTKLYNDANI